MDEAGQLVAFGFDHEDWDNHPDNYDADEITRQLGLPQSLARPEPEACTEPPWDTVLPCEHHAIGMHYCRSAAGAHRVHECVCGIQRYVPQEVTS